MMRLPALEDTIVAASTGWSAAPLGVIRLSGPQSFALAVSLGGTPPRGACPCWTDGRLLVSGATLPATVFWFQAPRSYTGQDVVELHTAGCLPLLRELCTELIARGARRALPGEFTARAFVHGRLDRRQVEGVLALMRAAGDSTARVAARQTRTKQRRLLDEAVERITQLLALVEAGIDFVEEEDVRFVTAEQVTGTLDALLAELRSLRGQSGNDPQAGKPHIALVGLPNAGKSTLFNALAGSQRALVSPVPGTTRDVLSVEVDLRGLTAVLQDCAGLGAATSELESATHLATEQAAQQADIVLWVHAADTAWDERESLVCAAVPRDRRVLAYSKTDLQGASLPRSAVPIDFVAHVETSALTGAGIAWLREVLATCLAQMAPACSGHELHGELEVATNALARARSVAADGKRHLAAPELVSVELRAALDALSRDRPAGPLDEVLLARVFAEFCIGK